MYRIIIFLLILTSAITAFAEIYKTVDENRQVIFSDKPSVEAEQVEVKVNSVEQPGEATDTEALLPFSGQVVMYTPSWYSVCERARQYMASRGISYKEYDIEKSSNVRRKFKRLGGRGVPLIFVGKQRMSGFSASQPDAMLAKAKQDT